MKFKDFNKEYLKSDKNHDKYDGINDDNDDDIDDLYIYIMGRPS